MSNQNIIAEIVQNFINGQITEVRRAFIKTTGKFHAMAIALKVRAELEGISQDLADSFSKLMQDFDPSGN